ncbi:type IX secretion system protein PorD [Melioribacter sp. OK-6-Me]|uniref:type IX secretion system protein PorD n=1 Tax=unclassified Melioribacter TaxID=2627329 RepID=UPI003ED87150
MKKLIFIIVSLFLLSTIRAQELDATVSVNYEQLPVAAKERLINFQSQIETYLNNTKFTTENWGDYKIRCGFNIFFLKAADDETTYKAQVVVTSQRPIENSERNSLMLNIFDNAWSFTYEKNQALYFNQSDFDPLVSFLDFYAYVIIGFDSDSYGKLTGTPYFSKALDIAIRGINTAYMEGWESKSTLYSRRGLVENLMNAKYQQFRMDFYDYHYNGLDLLSSEPEAAYKNIVKLIINLDKVKDQLDPRSPLLKVFFDAKAGEIAELLKNYPDNKPLFEALKKIDPPHISKYDEAMKVD